jgi:hypothetical protein
MLDRRFRAAVAIPARDEAERLPSCLDALARQRSGHGQTVDPPDFAVLVFANNCADATPRVARRSRAAACAWAAVPRWSTSFAALTWPS